MAGVPGLRLFRAFRAPSAAQGWRQPEISEDTMAYTHAPAPLAFADRALRRIGAAVLTVPETIATAGPKAEALRRLTQMSDDELAARGTTRDAEVRRVLGIDGFR
jgi:hypothetical protein